MQLAVSDIPHKTNAGRRMPSFKELSVTSKRNALFSSLFSLVIALHYLFFRTGMTVDYRACLTAFLLSLILLLLPTQLRRLTTLPTMLNNEGALTLLTMLGLVGVSYLLPGSLPIYPLGALGLVLFMHSLWHIKGMGRNIGLIISVGWLLLMAHEAAIIYLNGATTPHYMARLLLGEQLVDTIYHSAILGMFKIFNVSSTGLDGLELHRYHVGSHWFFARLAAIGDISPMAFYHISVPILIIPWFYKAIVALAAQVREWIFGDDELTTASWLLLIVSVGMLKMDRLFKVFTSESFGFALILAFLFCSMLVALCRNWEELNKKKLQLSGHLLLMLSCCLFATMSKFSVGWFICCVIGWSYLRLGGYKNFLVTLIVATTAALVLTTTQAMLPINNLEGMVPFGWLIKKGYASPGPFLKHILAHHLWVLALISAVFYTNRSFRFFNFPRPDRLAVEFATVLTIITLMPTTIMNVGGENTFSVTRWLALVLCMVWFSSLDFKAIMAWRAPYSRYALWAVVAYLLFGTAQVSIEKWGECLERVAYHGTTYTKQIEELIDDPDFAKRQSIFAQLSQMRSLPMEHKRSTAVYVPKSETPYWFWRPEEMNKGLKTMSYVAPALSEHAQIYGLPTDRNPGPLHYGLLAYPEDQFAPMPKTGEDIEAYAKKRGFDGFVPVLGD